MKESYIQKYAKIIVIIAVVFGATSGTLGKAMSLEPIAIGFWRLTMGLPFFAVPVFASRTGRESLKAIDKKDLTWALTSGVFLFAHFSSWFSAIKMTTIASASVLATLHPLVVVAISIIIYKKKIGIKPLAGIIVALIGGAITAGFDFGELTPEYFAGDMWALSAATFMGLYFAIGERIRERVPGATYVFLVFFACWVSFLIAMVVTGTPFFGYTAMDFVLVALMALLCQIGSHAMLNLCLGHVDSLYVSAWETADPVFGIFFAVVFLGQMPKAWAILGCAIVIGGLLYFNKHRED